MKPALLYFVLPLCSAPGYLKAQSECRSTVPVIAFGRLTRGLIVFDNQDRLSCFGFCGTDARHSLDPNTA